MRPLLAKPTLMRPRWLLCGLALMLGFASHADITSAKLLLEKEFVEIIDAIKVGNAASRTKAVRDIVLLRQSLADTLRDTVKAANEGTSSPGAKATALCLIGDLGLTQCRAILESEAEFEYWPPPPDEVEWRPYIRHFGQVGDLAIQSAGFGDLVVAQRVDGTISLTQYPTFAEALGAVSSDNEQERSFARALIWHWARMLEASMSSVLKPEFSEVYTPEAKIAAVFLLGELCVRESQVVLLESAGLKDSDSVVGSYPSTLKVRGEGSEFPAVNALLKCGHRVDIKAAIERLTENNRYRRALSDAECERIMGALVRINAEGTRRVIEDSLRVHRNFSPEDLAGMNVTDEWRTYKLDVLTRLSSMVPSGTVDDEK